VTAGKYFKNVHSIFMAASAPRDDGKTRLSQVKKDNDNFRI
jgi:hypothetical protein